MSDWSLLLEDETSVTYSKKLNDGWTGYVAKLDDHDWSCAVQGPDIFLILQNYESFEEATEGAEKWTALIHVPYTLDQNHVSKVEAVEVLLDILVKSGTTINELMIGVYNAFAWQHILVQNDIEMTEEKFRPAMDRIRELVTITEDWQ